MEVLDSLRHGGRNSITLPSRVNRSFPSHASIPKEWTSQPGARLRVYAFGAPDALNPRPCAMPPFPRYGLRFQVRN